MENPFTNIQALKTYWPWFFCLGALLILLGIGIITLSSGTSLFSIILLGCFLLIAGIVQLIQAILAHRWTGLFLALFLGILYIITGFLCVTKPATAAISITFWIAAFFLAIGLFKTLSSWLLRFQEWKWVFANGVISFILGILITIDWPFSGLWVIGLFIGIDLILSGLSWMRLSMAVKK